MRVSWVQDSSDGLLRIVVVVVSVHCEVIDEPTSIHNQATFLSFLVDVCDERCADLYSGKAVSRLLNLKFLGMVEDSTEFDLFEVVFLFDLLLGEAREGVFAMSIWRNVNEVFF